MIGFNLEQAQLFRMLVTVFGEDRVIPNMSVLAVCGGSLPAGFEHQEIVNLAPEKRAKSLSVWAKENRCLFTIVDQFEEPRLVVEFFSGFSSSIDAVEAEHQQYLKPILAAAKLPYLTIDPAEFDEILDPCSGVDFSTLLHHKLMDAE